MGSVGFMTRTHLSVRISGEGLEAVAREAGRLQVSRNDVVRRALAVYFSRSEVVRDANVSSYAATDEGQKAYERSERMTTRMMAKTGLTKEDLA